MRYGHSYSTEEFEDIKGVIRNRRLIYLFQLILYSRVCVSYQEGCC